MIKSKIRRAIEAALERLKAWNANQATPEVITNTAPNPTLALARSAGRFNHK